MRWQQAATAQNWLHAVPTTNKENEEEEAKETKEDQLRSKQSE